MVEGAHNSRSAPFSYSGRSSSIYLPRRGRIQEGAALAVYFAMNISCELGDIHRSGITSIENRGNPQSRENLQNLSLGPSY